MTKGLLSPLTTNRLMSLAIRMLNTMPSRYMLKRMRAEFLGKKAVMMMI